VARDNGFKAIVAYQGETGKYAKKKHAESDYFRYEITGNNGWTVLNWLKEDKELQHIPVHNVRYE
jgi:hypothetical protein